MLAKLNLPKLPLLFLPLFTLITLGVSMSPWFFMLLATPPDRIYGGVNRWSADYYIYASFVETGYRGKLREYHLTTTKPQEPIVIHGVYTLSGMFGRLVGVDPMVVYHLDRLIFGGIFIVILYLFFQHIFRSTWWAATALIFVFWIPGFPKTFDILGRFDNRYLSWVQEMNIIGRSTSPPHYLVGFSLFVLTLWAFMTLKGNIVKRGIILVVLTTLGTIANPVNILTLLATIGIYTVLEVRGGLYARPWGTISWKKTTTLVGLTLLTFVGSLPIAWYYHQKLSIFPWGPRSNALKFYIPGASIEYKELLLALGPVVAFALVGVIAFILKGIKGIRVEKGKDRQKEKWILLFLSWIVVQFGLLGLSGPWGIDPLRFLQGLYYIPLSGLAVYGLQGIRSLAKKYLAKFKFTFLFHPEILLLSCFLISIPTLVLSYKEELFGYTDFKSFSTLVYPTKAQYEAYKFMEREPFGRGVLAFYETTEVLPAFSGVTTERDLSYADKVPFFSNAYTPDQAREYLAKHYFSYIWYGYQEKAPGFNPAHYLFLKNVFENKEVSIYKVD